MFTGIIKAVGKVKSLTLSGASAEIVVEAEGFWDDAGIGDSISVDGVCLTVTKKSGGRACFDVSRETLDRSVLGGYKPADKVNLEKALLPTDRLGGHFVQGHVDGVGKYRSSDRIGENIELVFEIPKNLTAYVVEKGSIALNGVSLTAASVKGNIIRVAVIPHTLKLTNLSELAPGCPVNVECDIIAKYTEKLALSVRDRELDIGFFKKKGFA
ncbi:MAG: riboflavin synthase [bacterium]|nr:MAG: riboflavin synthase [bacterium]